MFGAGIEEDVATAWQSYDRLMALRRHEHIEAGTFSLLHYREAETVLGRWVELLDSVKKLYNSKIAEDYKPAFFELVLHPIKASAIYTSLRVHLAGNQLWAEQRRNSANTFARTVLDLFDADFQLSEEFHSLLNGKWIHIMRQTHYGYKDTWHAPSRDMISGLCFVQARQDSNPLVGQLGVAVEGHAGVRPGRCNEESDRTHPSRRDLVPGVTLGAMTPYGPSSRWFEVYTRGSMSLSWECSCALEWVELSKNVVLGPDDRRVKVTIDWSKVPSGFSEEILIDVRSKGGNYGPYGDDFEQVHLPVINRAVKGPFSGHVETDGYVSVPASRADSLEGYRSLPYLGRLDTGAVSIEPGITEPPFLVFPVYTFEDATQAHIELQFNMTLDIDPLDTMSYELQLDDGEVKVTRLVAEPDWQGDLPPGWYHAVQDCVWSRRHDVGHVKPGRHEIRLRFRHSNVLLERVILDLGGVKPSYLGPPPSTYVTLT